MLLHRNEQERERQNHPELLIRKSMLNFPRLEWGLQFHLTFYFYMRMEKPSQEVQNGTSISKRGT